jgi:acetyl-CoA C-acetyltransferase
MVFESFKEAIGDAKIAGKDIDATVVCSAPEYDRQRSPAGVLVEYLGLNPQPTFNVETLCSSGTTGIRAAYSLVKSGLHDIVAVLGFQKTSEITAADSQERMGRGADIQWESPFGTTMPAYFAMFARGHMEKYGTTMEDMTRVRIKASTYGVLNEKAMIRKVLTINDFNAPASRLGAIHSSPLRVGDCCKNADGSSCIILANEEKSKAMSEKPVWILGLGSASASVNMAGRETFYSFHSAKEAAKKAYKMAGVQPGDIDVAEVHDGFTIAEIMAYEDLGFARPGDGPGLIASKETYKEGKIPVNVDGGILSKGHPIAATGGSQVRAIVLQLRGESGDFQVKDPALGLVHNVGGAGLYTNVIILGRE